MSQRFHEIAEGRHRMNRLVSSLWCSHPAKSPVHDQPQPAQ